MNTVAISVQQIAGRDPETADIDGPAEFRHVRIRVRDARASCEALEANRFSRGKIAHRSVSQIADTIQGTADLRVKFADQCPGARNVVDIFNDENFWPGDTRDVLPPVGAVIVAESR